MRYAKINKMDIVNGDGIGVSIFLQGCSHHCEGCFNKETWDFCKGKEFTKEIENKFIELCKYHYVDHISLLGGEPFDQDEHIYYFLKRLKQEVHKPIWLWTGYTYEQCMYKDVPRDILQENLVDYLIDGKFIEELKDINLKLRGSSNQRIIDIKETNSQGRLILLDY